MGKKLLIVEDEQTLIKPLTLKLEHEGYTVLNARDGSEGLNLALSEHPDLILLDILMPTMDGLTLLDKLREDAWGETAQVIVLTNFANEEREKHAKDKGVVDYIIKSNWSLVDVIEKIKKYAQ